MKLEICYNFQTAFAADMFLFLLFIFYLMLLFFYIYYWFTTTRLFGLY